MVCVPLLVPLLTLMERPSITSEGAELWETNDQGCDIMLRHLQAARDVANNAQSYTANAQKILRGKTRNLKMMFFYYYYYSGVIKYICVCFYFILSFFIF